jgi:RimJ/RimL family protein N-acetyltransferase
MDWERIPTINASRVSLRPVTEKHLDSLCAVFSDPEVMRYSGSSMKDPREVKDFLAEVIEDAGSVSNGASHGGRTTRS